MAVGPCLRRLAALLLLAASAAPVARAAGLNAQCQSYLKGKGLEGPSALKGLLQQCTPDVPAQAKYAPNPRPNIEGATDTTPLSCRYGNPSMFGPTGGTCCGWKPHFNWVVASCAPSKLQSESLFCRGIPLCARTGGLKINYVAAYQYNGEEFVLMEDSTAGDVTKEGVSGSFKDGTGWEKRKADFAWAGGDWTSKFAPWGEGPSGPRGGTPPGMMWVISADSFYYGAFYMLSQLTLNLQGAGNPTGTNCWTWEIDPVEGTLGWLPPGAPTPGNLNQLYSTNNAVVSGCMPVTYSALQAEGNTRLFTEPQHFQDYCKDNPTEAGCQPWVQNVMWSGGVQGTQRFENYADQPYVFAVVVDSKGYWIYRWIPDKETGTTGWPGINRTSAARVLPKRPKAVTQPGGLSTDVRGDVAEAVILQPSVPPEAACLRSSSEWINWQFGADALGAIATQLGENKPGDPLEGAQNWWAHFADTEQYQNYPISIAGVPTSTLEYPYTCNTAGTFGCDCKAQAKQRRLQAQVRNSTAPVTGGRDYV